MVLKNGTSKNSGGKFGAAANASQAVADTRQLLQDTAASINVQDLEQNRRIPTRQARSLW